VVPPLRPQPVADPAYQGLVRFHAFAAAANSPNRSYTPPLPTLESSDIALPESSEDMLRSTRFIDDTCAVQLPVIVIIVIKYSSLFTIQVA